MKIGSFIGGIVVGGILVGGFVVYKKFSGGSSWWDNIYF